MSLVQKILPNRSGYVLQVTDLHVAGGAAQLRRAPYTAVSKRALALVLALAFIALTSVSGFFMATKASPKASADWVSDIFCTSLGDDDLSKGDGLTTGMDNAYGGTNTGENHIWSFGTSATAGLSAAFSSGILSVKSTDDTQKTAYEVFTPFLPMFDAWNGDYVDSGAGNDTLVFHYPLKVSKGVPSNQLPEVNYTGGSAGTLGKSALFAHNVGADCIAGPAGKAFGTSVTNSLFMIPKMITFFSAEVYGWAYQNAAISEKGSALHTLLYGDPGQTNGLNSIITGTPTTEGLRDVLYLPFLLPIVMLAALWIAYNALVRKRTNSATQGLIWLVAASITGLLFLSHPDVVPAVADKIVTTVDSATMTALNGSGDENQTEAGALCSLGGKETTEKTVRELKCYMWYNTIYIPWLSGQFGSGEKISAGNNILTQNAGFTSSGSGKTANNTILDKTTIALGDNTLQNAKGAGNKNPNTGRWYVNWGTFELQEQARNWNGTHANQLNALAFSQLSGNAGAKVNTTWGGDIMRQANAAILSAIAAIGTMILVLTSGFLLLGYQISMIFLLMLSPFFFLIGALPGLGKGIMMRWFELIASTIIKRIVLTFVIALFLRLYSLIMGLDLAWWLQVVLMIIIAVVAMSQRANIVNTFSKAVDFGGNKNIGDGTEGARTLGKRLASGAALAGLGALGAKGGFGGVGGTGSKLKTAAGNVANLAGKGKGPGGGNGGSGNGSGAIGGNDDNPSLPGGADGTDPSATDINGLPIGESNPEVDAPHIVTEELPPMIVGVEYEAQIIAVGAPKPDLTVTGLPNGLSFSPADGKIKGKPEREGNLKNGDSSNVSVEINVTAKATNTHGDDDKEYKVPLFNGAGSGADSALKDYKNNEAIRGSDINRAKDMASEATYERARLSAEANGKPDMVKGKHSPDAYNKRMSAAIGAKPDASKFANKNDYAKAMTAYNAKSDKYKQDNPYADFAGDSILRKRRKAEITGQIDPADQALLDARNKAMRTAALGGFERGFVENKDGSLKLDRGAMYRQYRDGYILGDVKSTNAEIKLDSKQDRIEAAETRGLLSRQIELQEESLRLQGGTVPPIGGGSPMPPIGGGSGPVSPITGAPRPSTPPTTGNASQPVPADEPVVTVGPGNTPAISDPITDHSGKSQEQLRQEIFRGRQQNAQERARITGGTPQKVTAPPKPRQRVQVDPSAQKPQGEVSQRPMSTPVQRGRVEVPGVKPLPQIDGYSYPGLTANRDIRNTHDLGKLDQEIEHQQARLDANYKAEERQRAQSIQSGDSGVLAGYMDRHNYNTVHAVDIQNLQAIAADARERFNNGELQELPQIDGYSYPGLSVDTNVQSPEDLARLDREIQNQQARLDANRKAEERQFAQSIQSGDPGVRSGYEDRRNYNTVHAVDIQNLQAIADQARSSFGSSSDDTTGGSVSFSSAPPVSAPQQQVRPAPAPAPRKPATSVPAPRQQQTQQQLRVTPAPAPAPRKPSTPAPAPQPAQQQTQQQQVRPAAAPAPKRPPVKLPPIKINVQNNAPEPQVQQVQQPQEEQQAPVSNFENEQATQQETKFLNSFVRETRNMESQYRFVKNKLDSAAIAARNGNPQAEREFEEAWIAANQFNSRVSGYKGKVRRYNDLVDRSARINPDTYKEFDKRDYRRR